MTGAELSKLFFESVFMPECVKKMPEAIGHFAAGLVGEGSECFGFDDELSRDHSFGLRLQIWLTDEDYALYGPGLTSLYAALPDGLEGFAKPAENPNEGKRNGVFTVSGFYKGILGIPGVPEQAGHWLAIPEPHFAAAVNGKVFTDSPGVFTEIRKKLLEHYPEDIQRFFLAQHAAIAAQTGQYNMLRAFRHSEELAVFNIKARFIQSAIAMVFLLNKVYRPFYKWAPRAMRSLPVFGADMYEKLVRLSCETDIRTSCNIVENICGQLISEMQLQGITEGKSDFLMDHLPHIMGGIKSDDVRRRGLSMVF